MFNMISDEEFQEILDECDAHDFQHYNVDWVSIAIFVMACVAIAICGALFALSFN